MGVNEAVSFLIKEGYLTLMAGEITITNKLKREYGTNIPVDISKLTADELYYKFIEDAEIPTLLPLGQGNKKYKVRQKSEPLKRAIKKALKTVSYDDLVQSTKNYYKQSNVSRLTLSN